jgi:hypothetical protein
MPSKYSILKQNNLTITARGAVVSVCEDATLRASISCANDPTTFGAAQGLQNGVAAPQ